MWRRGLALAVLGAVVLMLWWGFFRSVEQVDTEPVRRGRVENAVSALGVLQPALQVEIGAQVSGQIRRIAVQAGEGVVKGQLLLEIDPAVQRATVQRERAELAGLRAQLAEQEAERDLARQQNLRQQQMAADGSTRLEDVQTADAALRKAEARLRWLHAQIDGARATLGGSEALLGYTRIEAPITGTVISLDAREGQTLNATYQTPEVMQLADLSRMTVWTEVSEADVGRIRSGMPVYFTTLGLEDAAGRTRRWTGTLRQLLPAPPKRAEAASGNGSRRGSASSGSGTVVMYTALFDVDNADGALMPGMSAQVFFTTAVAEDVLVVPLAALTPIEGRADHFNAQVWVDGEAQPRELELGVRDRLRGEVRAGLAEGDAIVLRVRREQGSQRLRW